MREKAVPFRSLPLGIVIWERLLKPQPKPKFAKKFRPHPSSHSHSHSHSHHSYPPNSVSSKVNPFASSSSSSSSGSKVNSGSNHPTTSSGGSSSTVSGNTIVSNSNNQTDQQSLVAVAAQALLQQQSIITSDTTANVSRVSISAPSSSTSASNQKWKKDSSSSLASHSVTDNTAAKNDTNSASNKNDQVSFPPTPSPSSKRGYLYLLQNESKDERSLNELQKHMIRIIKENGGRASIDTLVDEVQKIWDSISKSGELKYIMDGRRAVFATLANSSSNPVFVRDLETGDGWWKLSKKASEFDLDAIEEESRQLLEKTRNDDDEGAEEEEEEEEEEELSDEDMIKKEEDESINDDEEEHEERITVEPLSKRRKRPISSKESRSSDDGSKNEESDENKEKAGTSSYEVSQLQGLIIEAITKNGGSASLETIQKHIAKFWANLRRRDTSLSTTDHKKAVKSSLLSASVLFKRDPNHEGNWKTTKEAMTLFETVREQVTEIPRLTGMQDMLMRILLSYGGVCTFEEIYDEVVKNGKSMRHLGADYKRISRAILASLSHNPPGNFKKADDGRWTIAPKAMAVAEQMTKEDPSYSLTKIVLED